jgi:hypothetical protein
MPCYVLYGLRENRQAVIMQKLCAGFIGTADFKESAVKLNKRQFVEPLTAVHRVERFGPLNYIGENLSYVLCRQRFFPFTCVLTINIQLSNNTIKTRRKTYEYTRV